jgi:hypothetical protein
MFDQLVQYRLTLQEVEDEAASMASQVVSCSAQVGSDLRRDISYSSLEQVLWKDVSRRGEQHVSSSIISRFYLNCLPT